MPIDDDKMSRLPDALRPVVSLWFDRLEEAHGRPALAEDIEDQLLRVVAVSEFAGNALLGTGTTGAGASSIFHRRPTWTN